MRPFVQADPSPSGFTLLELLVVIGLLSLMTALAIPAVRTTLLEDQLKAAAMRLSNLIIDASQQALQEQQPLLLRFNLARSNVVVAPPRRNIQEAEKALHTLQLPREVRIAGVSTAHGGTFNTGEPILYLSAKGYVDRSNIHLRDAKGREMTLQLSPFLGTIELADSHVPLE